MRNKEALLQAGVSARVWLGSSNARARSSAAAAFFGVLLAAGLAEAAEYYVAPTGSDSNTGTMASPFATLQKGNDAAAAGDTVWVRGGTYSPTGQTTFSKSGTSDTNRTKIWAYTGEVPVIDASKFSLASETSDHPFITVSGNWMHIKGLEIANAAVGTNGSHSYSMFRTKNASNNTFELLNIHGGFGPGLFVDTGNGGNLILNCDSWNNYDVNGSQGDGQNGDGFGVHYQTTGPSTTVRGCRAWMDSDDGYDLISQEVPVTVENNWAFSNGRGSGGNGNGFKMGSSQTGIRHLVQNNVAWKNKDSGFYANHSTGGNTWYNNTSYMNGTQYNMLASSFDSGGNVTGTITLSGAKAHIMRNNIGFPNKNANMTGVDTMFNTWDLGIAEAATDFASTSDTGCTGPREADGSLPSACTFMKLKAGSPLIDKGTNVQLPYVGSAPDLGAYEYGAVAPDGGVGTTTTGGTTGTATTGGTTTSGAASTGDAGARTTTGGTTGRGTTGANGTTTGTATTGPGSTTTGATGATSGTTTSGSGGTTTGPGSTTTTGGGGTTVSGGNTSANTTGATAGNTSTGTGTGSGATSSATSGGGATAATSAGADTSSGATATVGGSATAGTSSGKTAADAGDPGGCGCRTAGVSRNLGGGSALFSLLGLAVVARRRRRTVERRAAA